MEPSIFWILVLYINGVGQPTALTTPDLTFNERQYCEASGHQWIECLQCPRDERGNEGRLMVKHE